MNSLVKVPPRITQPFSTVTCHICKTLQQNNTRKSLFFNHFKNYYHITNLNHSKVLRSRCTGNKFSNYYNSIRRFYDFSSYMKMKMLGPVEKSDGNMVLNIYQYVLDLPRWHFMAMLFSGYLFYYFVEVVKRPILAVKDGPLKQFLIKNVPEIEMKFWPTFWCVESRAQTVFASILRASVLSNIDYRRELFTMKDGGEVALDWLETNCTSDSPIIVILPGLTGESQAEYIKCLVMSANRVGIRTVVFNQRGLGGVALKTPRMYCAAKCEDLCEVLDHVRALNPHVKMGATGISMGGLILGNYLAKHADEAEKILTSAKIISAPWNVFKGCDSIQKPYLNNMLGRHLADSLCRTVDQYEILKNVDHYYTEATMHDKLHSIKVPLLCLSAADDPFQPLDALPLQDAETSSHVCFIVTARGGHIAFLEGWWPTSREQYMSRLFSQFFSVTLNDKDHEFEKISEQLKQDVH
uniref:CSON011682 protein n=1 Tax=Culicoides sonorensis TaxID=179676 RepID=A0A336M7Q7_CULSO